MEAATSVLSETPKFGDEKALDSSFACRAGRI
jgi:hypothetical protein